MLTDDQVRDLKIAHKQTRDKRLADRIKAVLYRHYGFSYTEIAKLLLFDEVGDIRNNSKREGSKVSWSTVIQEGKQG